MKTAKSGTTAKPSAAKVTANHKKRPIQDQPAYVDLDIDDDDDFVDSSIRPTIQSSVASRRKEVTKKFIAKNPSLELAIVIDKHIEETELGALLRSCFLVEGQETPIVNSSSSASSSSSNNRKANANALEDPKYYLFFDNCCPGLILWTHREHSFGGRCSIRKYKADVKPSAALYISGDEFVDLASSSSSQDYQRLVDRILEAQDIVVGFQSSGGSVTVTVLVSDLDKALLTAQLKQVIFSRRLEFDVLFLTFICLPELHGCAN